MLLDLSAKLVAALGEGRHRVARNLYLLSTAKSNGTVSRSWVLIYTSPKTGRRVDMGLGSADLVSVARAKELALRHRLAILEGRCPLTERREARKKERPRILNFHQVAELYLGAHAATWRNAKHRAQWSATLDTYAGPVLGDLPVAQISTAEIMRVLEPIWHEKPETASRVRGRIETVLDYAAARHWRTGGNPARWRGHLESLLPHRSKVRTIKHHAAVPWRDLPALWVQLAGRADISALALCFTLITGVRTNEAIGARWTELDLDRKVWTIPATRMKAGREFRIPLSAAALALLDRLATLRQGEFVFPGARHGRPISNMTMLELLRGLRPGTTVHGTVRSGFRDWAAEHGVAREVAETALAHVVADKTEAAYLRGDLLEPRRIVAENWRGS